MEKSYIKKMELKYLYSIDINKNEIDEIYKLVKEGIEKKLYSKSLIPYHNIYHIERVLIYCYWITNLIEKEGFKLENKEYLFKAALYHDCGRSLNPFRENHGIVGAKKACELLANEYDEKGLKVLELLIETHALKDDIVDYKGYSFTHQEKMNIQMLSNILKDADALDRNRIKLFSFAQCKVEYLRTKEAKEIYLKSDELYNKYIQAMKK